jgi:hypothetical protein
MAESVRTQAALRWGLLLLALAVSSTGCVQRRMTIRTNPPGALVYVDNYEIGTTPVSTDFIYYGTRQIRLVKDGYETLVIDQPIRAPWYQWFPLDFVSENLIPAEIRDERTFSFQLQPQRMEPPENVLERANQLRQSGAAQAAYVAPAAPSAPGGFAAPMPGSVPSGAYPPGYGGMAPAVEPLPAPGPMLVPQSPVLPQPLPPPSRPLYQ